jgi:hypothetical protein
MKRAHSLIIVGLLLVIAGLSLVGNSPGTAQAATPAATKAATLVATKAATAVATKVVTPQPIKDPLGKQPTFLAAYYDAWVKSAHANKDSEPFKHWNAEGQVPTDCATCHSTVGYVDFLGGDGSAAGKVDKPAPIGGVINCDGCHNPAAASLKLVAFPSGAKVGDIGDATRCIVCHQGRSSTVQVNAAIEKANLSKDPNKVDPSLGFINIHYFAAAASLYGNEVQGGYQFAGKVYQGRNRHVPGYDTCVGCHSPHTLQVKVEECATCHKNVKDEKDLRNIRMNGSLTDFNGNGDIKEGIAAEIDGLRTVLMKTMQAYATKISGKGIAYDPNNYPYFFLDTNGNGQADKDEAVAKNAFKLFTPVLLEAAYNYQVSVKDPGGFAHNPKYHIQLLFDSIEALNAGMGGPGDTAKIQRNPPGHFDASGEPFRHWDKDGEVPGSCAKCHAAEGLPVFLKNGTAIAVKPGNSLNCSTCHDDLTKFTVRPSEKVTFPSGAVVSFGKREADNICLNCHQGRESTVSVNNAIKASGAKGDEVSDKLNFRNVHYFAAGASLFGTDAKGAYEFEGKKYNGRNMHESPFQTCNDCHNVHTLKVNFSECGQCHKDVKDPRDIRAKEDDVDYNGNGKTDEPITAEIASFQDALIQQLSAYAKKNGGVGIVYDPNSYPYFFADTNGNGKADKEEVNADNAYKKWTPNLLRGAYNYQYSVKDPGVFAHNPHYIMQVLYDSVEALGGKDAVAKLTRPEVKASSN